jgi:ankyrin repeat protein
METRSKRRKTEPVVDKIRRGEISVVVALAEDLPDVFYSEILPKLDLISTLNLAQVSKRYNDAVWSVDGVRSMEAKIKAKIKATSTGYSSEPLYWAAYCGNVPAVRAILKSGVDVNVSSHDCTPLHYAAGHGHTPMVKVLIEAGADVNKKGHCGKTSLHVAAIEGHAPVIMKLIKAGADVNATDDYGNTPLHYATRSREEDCIALLLVLGAGVHKAPKRWITLMRIAVQRKYNKIIEMLKQVSG